MNLIDADAGDGEGTLHRRVYPMLYQWWKDRSVREA
jgi:hypothetical protein